MPRTVEQQLPSIEMARLGCRIIASHGKALRQLLLESGILYVMDKHDSYNVRHTIRTEKLRCKGNARRLHELNTFCQNLALEEDGECTEPLFSLQAFNSFFTAAVYVVRDHPSGVSDTWPYLRCTCDQFSKHSGCEHIEYVKSLDILNMQDQPNSRDSLSAPLQKMGRKRGSCTTARGKAAAAKKNRTV